MRLHSSGDPVSTAPVYGAKYMLTVLNTLYALIHLYCLFALFTLVAPCGKIQFCDLWCLFALFQVWAKV